MVTSQAQIHNTLDFINRWGLIVRLLQSDSSLNLTRGEIIVYQKEIIMNNSEHWSPAKHSIHNNRPTMALKSSTLSLTEKL